MRLSTGEKRAELAKMYTAEWAAHLSAAQVHAIYNKEVCKYNKSVMVRNDDIIFSDSIYKSKKTLKDDGEQLSFL